MEDHVAVAHDDAMMLPQFCDADLAEWLAGLSSPPHSPEKIVHHQMEDGIKLLLLGPQDEKHLPSIFGLLDHGTHKLEDKSDLITRDDTIVAKQTHSDHDIEDYVVVPSLLDFLPIQAGGHGRRKRRKRSTSWKAEISHLCGLLKPFASRDKKFGIRKNNKHWAPLEVKKLVKGTSEYGVGKWTDVKRAYFKRSFRKPAHLKDKWRDLLRACGVQVGSKEKVQAQKATMRIVEGWKDEIIKLNRKHASQRGRASS